jgi:hypothetical protein
MNRFLFGALAMGAFIVLTSFALRGSTRSASQAPVQDPQGAYRITVSYSHDDATGTNSAFAWEWNGNEIVAATKYDWTSRGVVVRSRAPKIEEKK